MTKEARREEARQRYIEGWEVERKKHQAVVEAAREKREYRMGERRRQLQAELAAIDAEEEGA